MAEAIQVCSSESALQQNFSPSLLEESTRRPISTFQIPIDKCGIQRDREKVSLHLTSDLGSRLQSKPENCLRQSKHFSRQCSGEGIFLRKDAAEVNLQSQHCAPLHSRSVQSQQEIPEERLFCAPIFAQSVVKTIQDCLSESLLQLPRTFLPSSLEVFMSRRHPSSFQLPIQDDNNCGIQRDRKRESLQVTAVPGTRLQSRPKKCCPKQLKHPSRLCSGEGSSLRKDASDSTHSGLLSGQGTLPVPFGTLNRKP